MKLLGRVLVFSLGIGLLVVTTFLNNYRATPLPDSNAIAIYEESYYEAVEKITRVDMVGNRTELFASSFYDELEIQHYEWSPDGQWMLVLLGGYNRYSELYVVSLDEKTPRKIYDSTRIFDFPRWTADSQSIFLAEPLESDTRSQVRIIQLARDGQLQHENIFEVEDRSFWDFAWFDTDTLWLSYSPSRPSGYFIDVNSGQITENDQSAYLGASNGVSPNGLWSLNVKPSHIELNQWGIRNAVLWSIPIGKVPVTPALRMGWSDDSEWIAMLTYPIGVLNSPSPSSSDIVIIDKSGEEIRLLINDNRAKDLVMTETRTNLIRPFSHRNGWLLYVDLYAPSINAVRTNGSGEELSDWYVSQQLYTASAKWSPPFEMPLESQSDQIAGGLLIVLALAWHGWQIRRLIL